jgi:hypothetical protein
MPQDAPKLTEPPLASPHEVIRAVMQRNGWNEQTARGIADLVMGDLAAARYTIIGTHFIEDRDETIEQYRRDAAKHRAPIAPLYAATGIAAGSISRGGGGGGGGLDLQAVAVKLNEVIERLNKLQGSREEEE